MGVAVNFAEEIARDMSDMTEETRKKVRPKLRAAGEAIASGARSNAAWSSRIPSTVRVQVSFRADREGVTVLAGGPSTPHARPFEDVRGKGFFRHPVFADSANFTRKGWTWRSQTSRPFLLPAAESEGAATNTAMRTALDEVGRSLGFGG